MNQNIYDIIYYSTREYIINTSCDKKALMLDENEKFNDFIKDASNQDNIRDNMTIDHDTILDINDLFLDNILYGYLIDNYAENMTKVCVFNKECKNVIYAKNILYYKVNIPLDLIKFIISKYL